MSECTSLLQIEVLGQEQKWHCAQKRLCGVAKAVPRGAVPSPTQLLCSGHSAPEQLVPVAEVHSILLDSRTSPETRRLHVVR